MKNLKKTGYLLLIMAMFAACSKDNKEAVPQSNIDFTQYYIAGKGGLSVNDHVIQVPYMITFEANAKAALIWGASSGDGTPGSYTYNNGRLIINWGTSTDTFTISNNAITGYEKSSGSAANTSYSLQKIPAVNQLDGNTYYGGLFPVGFSTVSVSFFKFNATQYGESDGVPNPTINKDYTLINNVAARITGNGEFTFLLLLNNKLEVARSGPANGGGTLYSIGTLVKQ